jgi:hypothetical protein
MGFHFLEWRTKSVTSFIGYYIVTACAKQHTHIVVSPLLIGSIQTKTKLIQYLIKKIVYIHKTSIKQQ